MMIPMLLAAMLGSGQVMDMNDIPPPITLAGAIIPDLLQVDGTKAYNKVMTELTKGYKGETALMVLPEAAVIDHLGSGQVDCALMSAPSVTAVSATTDIDDLGNISSLAIRLYGHQSAPDIRTMDTLKGQRIAASAHIAGQLDGITITQTINDVREGIRLMLREDIDFFIGYGVAVSEILKRARAGTRLKMLNPPLAMRHNHVVCLALPKTEAFRNKARTKIDDIRRSGWIDAVMRMN